MSKIRWEAYEDNAGGLYMVILKDGYPSRIFENWEYGPEGALADAVKQLADDPTVYEDWEGDLLKRLNEDAEEYGMHAYTIEKLYDDLVAEMIADSYGVYEARMGAAGHRAFGV